MPVTGLDRPLISALATALTFAAYLPYIRSIARGHTRPHVFTWTVWGVATGIAFLAVLRAGGGAGAWPIGFSGAVTLFVAVLAYIKRSDITITRADWLMFVAALSAMPIWLATNDPLWAVVLITAIELLGFGPTLRKTWLQPHSESMSFLAIMVVRNALILAALDHLTMATVLFPATSAAACGLLIAVMTWRRPHIGA